MTFKKLTSKWTSKWTSKLTKNDLKWYFENEKRGFLSDISKSTCIWYFRIETISFAYHLG